MEFSFNLLFYIVSFINNRVQRDVLGFTMERCLKLRIVPCTVRVPLPFQEHLAPLCAARRAERPLFVYDAPSRIAVSLKFWWRSQRLTLKVRTQMRLEVLKVPPCILSTAKSEQRTYYTYPDRVLALAPEFTEQYPNMTEHFEQGVMVVGEYAEWPLSVLNE